MKAVTGSHNTNNIGSAIDVSSNTIIASNNGINFKNCTSTKVGQPQITTGNLVGGVPPQGGTMMTPKTHLIGSQGKTHTSVGAQQNPNFR
jgi:hypothetical protein